MIVFVLKDTVNDETVHAYELLLAAPVAEVVSVVRRFNMDGVLWDLLYQRFMLFLHFLAIFDSQR